MTPEQRDRLRELAGKAADSDWGNALRGTRFGQFCALYPELGGMLLACDPSTILALLDENKALRARIDELENGK